MTGGTTGATPGGAQRRLGWSSIMAGIGDGVVAVALPLLAARLTTDPLRVASVVAAQHLPWPLVAVLWRRIAGDRRTTIGLADTARALMLGLLGLAVLLGRESLALILLAAFMVGLGEALTDGAETETDDVSSLSTRGMVGLAVIGLPLGGALYEIFPATPFLFDVLAFTLASTFALTLAGPRTAPAEEDVPTLLVPALPLPARLTFAAVTASSLATSMVLGVLVLFAIHDLGLGAPAFGVLLAGLAGSAMVGGLVAPEIGHVLGIRTGLIAALVFGGLAHVAAAALADETVPLLSAIALGLAAAAGMAVAVLGRAQLQRQRGTADPDSVTGFLHLACWAAIPVGALAGGAVAHATSVGTAVAAAAVAWCIGALCAAAARPTGTPPTNPG